MKCGTSGCLILHVLLDLICHKAGGDDLILPRDPRLLLSLETGAPGRIVRLLFGREPVRIHAYKSMMLPSRLDLLTAKIQAIIGTRTLSSGVPWLKAIKTFFLSTKTSLFLLYLARTGLRKMLGAFRVELTSQPKSLTLIRVSAGNLGRGGGILHRRSEFQGLGLYGCDSGVFSRGVLAPLTLAAPLGLALFLRSKAPDSGQSKS
jgi:hypothetical protein